MQQYWFSYNIICLALQREALYTWIEKQKKKEESSALGRFRTHVERSTTWANAGSFNKLLYFFLYRSLEWRDSSPIKLPAQPFWPKREKERKLEPKETFNAKVMQWRPAFCSNVTDCPTRKQKLWEINTNIGKRPFVTEHTLLKTDGVMDATYDKECILSRAKYFAQQ